MAADVTDELSVESVTIHLHPLAPNVVRLILDMDIKKLLSKVVENNASDLHLSVGLTPVMRINGLLVNLDNRKLDNNDILGMLLGVLPKAKSNIPECGEIDTMVYLEDIGRFRTNIYQDYRGICAAFRLISKDTKSLEELGLPSITHRACHVKSGFVLVTGITGSGKSTTLQSMIDTINSSREEHIITIEDPIEYVHEPKKSIINQREVGVHTKSFPDALRSVLREDPNVILIGEMRDLETISMALTAAETGHLVFATLHTKDATQSINRIIDVFPPQQQEQVRLQLADTLEMTISQVLLTSLDGKARHLACEIMIVNSAIRQLIREKKTHQIKSTIENSVSAGMQTLEKSLRILVNEGKISKRSAIEWISDKKLFDSYG